MKLKFKYGTCFTAILLITLNTFSQQKNTVNIKVNPTETGKERLPIWAWFGYDEPNYTYMKDGKKLLSEIAMLSGINIHTDMCAKYVAD